MSSGASRVSAALRAFGPEYDADSSTATERELDRRHKAPFTAAFDTDDAEEQPDDFARSRPLGAESRAGIEGAPALGERIEEEPGGGVQPLGGREASGG